LARFGNFIAVFGSGKRRPALRIVVLLFVVLVVVLVFVLVLLLILLLLLLIRFQFPKTLSIRNQSRN